MSDVEQPSPTSDPKRVHAPGYHELPAANAESVPGDPLFVRQMSTPATIFLTFVNLAVFAAMLVRSGLRFEPSVDMLLNWGANYGPLTATSQPWRMFTSMFLHGGVIHIAFNMYALWQLGQLVERFYGSARFMIIYLLAGLAGSCASLMYHPGTVGVGASGAIFGVLGALLSYATVERMAGGDPRFRRMQSSVLNCIVINLIIGYSIPHIDNSAHLGGLAFGILAGFLLAPIPIPGISLKVKARELLGTVLLLALLAGLVPIARHTARDRLEVQNATPHESDSSEDSDQ